MENDIKTIGSTKDTNANDLWFENPLGNQIRNRGIGTDPQFENVGNTQKQVRINWRMISNTIDHPNGKPLAQTLSQKTLAIHKYNSKSIGTQSVPRKPLAYHDDEYTIQPNLKWFTEFRISLACHHSSTLALHDVKIPVVGLWSRWWRNNKNKFGKWLINVYHLQGYMFSVMSWV